MANAQNIGLTQWQNMLRSVYYAGPLAGGALAVCALTAKVLAGALEIRDANRSDELIQRSLVTWDAEAEGLLQRLSRYLDFLRTANQLDPASRLLQIQAYVGEPLLTGKIPGEFFEGLPVSARAGVRFDSEGNGRVLGGDGARAATLWNQVLAALTVAPEPGFTLDLLASAFSDAALQLEQSGPGEDPTAADAVATTLDTAATGVSTLVGAIAGNTTVKVAVGAALGLGLLWLLSRR